MRTGLLDKPEIVYAEITVDGRKVMAVKVEVYVEDYWMAADALNSLVEVVKDEIKERL